MKIVVCVKQVPDTAADIKIDPETSTLMLDGVEHITNPFDEFAIEEALLTREKHGGEVHVITMGPPQAVDVLRNALAMGADQAYLLCDTAFAGADTLATSYTLSKAIEKIGGVDLVVCGKQAVDGDTAQVGPSIATYLKIPQLTYVSKVREIDSEKGRIVVERMLEGGIQAVESSLPALMTVVKDINEPRLPSLLGIRKAAKTEIPTWTAVDLPVDQSRLGLDGSPTWVARVSRPEQRRGGEILQGEIPEVVSQLVDKLLDAKVLK
ncbi:MAG: electron transfer flavoprotein subunit beta [Proteobacteria bacterium]|nr:electron transfer flavoprotein subunit beta [Pseudomonadota bacterium]NIS72459.1 electron transfer flavoprotein subunit beta [Pseudomonadota bacterium]